MCFLIGVSITLASFNGWVGVGFRLINDRTNLSWTWDEWPEWEWREMNGRDWQIGWEKWIKHSLCVSVLGSGKVCVLNDRFFGPIIQNLHVGRWRLFGEQMKQRAVYCSHFREKETAVRMNAESRTFCNRRGFVLLLIFFLFYFFFNLCNKFVGWFKRRCGNVRHTKKPFGFFVVFC